MIFFRIILESYYAVFYDDQYYLGRAIELVEGKIKMKFLTKVLNKYYWPKKDDIDLVEEKFVLLKLDLKGNCPYEVTNQQQQLLNTCYKSFKNQ